MHDVAAAQHLQSRGLALLTPPYPGLKLRTVSGAPIVANYVLLPPNGCTLSTPSQLKAEVLRSHRIHASDAYKLPKHEAPCARLAAPKSRGEPGPFGLLPGCRS
jgi:hypothetical protein